MVEYLRCTEGGANSNPSDLWDWICTALQCPLLLNRDEGAQGGFGKTAVSTLALTVSSMVRVGTERRGPPAPGWGLCPLSNMWPGRSPGAFPAEDRA